MIVLATVTFIQDTLDPYVQTQQSSGIVRLVSSLQGTNITTINVTIHATDGRLVSNPFTLVIQVIDWNQFPPKFDQAEYHATISEGAPVGTTVLRLSAFDQDSVMLYFYITGGNQDQMFSVNVNSGSTHASIVYYSVLLLLLIMQVILFE